MIVCQSRQEIHSSAVNLKAALYSLKDEPSLHVSAHSDVYVTPYPELALTVEPCGYDM